MIRTFLVLFKQGVMKDVLWLWARSSFNTNHPYLLYGLVKFDTKVLRALLIA